MKSKQKKIVIIGNGVAGNNAALSARRQDKDCAITILSKEPYREYAAGALPDYLAGALEYNKVFVKENADYAGHGICLKLSRTIKSVDTQERQVTVLEGGKEEILAYNKLILATGSFPIVPPIPGSKNPGNFVLKSLGDAQAIMAYPADSAVIVGSGAIGIEGALALKARGISNICVIELMERIYPKSFDTGASAEIQKMLEDMGIHIYTGEKLEGIIGETEVTGVQTSKREIPCQMLIWAVGVRPEVSLGKELGVTLGATGGILTNAYMQTNIADVYACGDCVESTDVISGNRVLNMLWEAASRQGRIAGTHAAGGEARFQGSFSVLLSYIGDVPILAVGATQESLGDREHQVFERRTKRTYRRALVVDGCLAGVQMIGTLEGAGPFLFSLRKGKADGYNADLQKPPMPSIVSTNLVKSFLSSYSLRV